jgi:hypothetical protein
MTTPRECELIDSGWKPYSTPGAGSSTGRELNFVFNSSVASTMYNWGEPGTVDPGVHDFGLQSG